MKLRPLTIRDKHTIEKFLRLRQHRLSVYTFENIYIWKALFDIRWCIINESLCIFFEDPTGCFLYLPPLGGSEEPAAALEAFRIMDGKNRNPGISRIENIETDDVAFFRESGYTVADKPGEYLCVRSELVQLKGERFKSKRACCNYFTAHNDFKYFDYSARFRAACLALYAGWMRERRETRDDAVYRGMLSDSLRCFEVLLKYYGKLSVTGKLVEIDGAIKACTFGFRISRETFCVLYEITDLSYKGLAQFIFREFCAGLNDYRYINIMDDSELPNLRTVKQSYHPAGIIPAFIAQRKNAGAAHR